MVAGFNSFVLPVYLEHVSNVTSPSCHKKLLHSWVHEFKKHDIIDWQIWPCVFWWWSKSTHLSWSAYIVNNMGCHTTNFSF